MTENPAQLASAIPVAVFLLGLLALYLIWRSPVHLTFLAVGVSVYVVHGLVVGNISEMAAVLATAAIAGASILLSNHLRGGLVDPRWLSAVRTGHAARVVNRDWISLAALSAATYVLDSLVLGLLHGGG